ncbi:uncharacterized protein N7496_000426 [Penicillium cataractarum]|uniref:Uncharacterized protein n=1 Tax=Penicillium cataractarum TaxID=2100454 RepID=A0A9X0B5X5_9EURO|nr:uncharacterized protein N7496_000426 [Penicillium cataractarum]KAJ5389358.1 hypothetical protein N7496_000426 [Penicillium cataractarum]
MIYTPKKRKSHDDGKKTPIITIAVSCCGPSNFGQNPGHKIHLLQSPFLALYLILLPKTIPSPTHGRTREAIDGRNLIAYSDGSYAWLDMWFAANVWKSFTTDNGDKLIDIEFSKPLLAAVSHTGLCHIWNIDASQSPPFPLKFPGQHQRILIKWTKVVIQYGEHIQHWCYDTKIVREIETTLFVAAVDPHPSEDQGLNSINGWCQRSSHNQPMPKSIFAGRVIDLDYLDTCGIHYTGHGSMMLIHGRYHPEGGTWDDGVCCVSLEPDGRVAFHTMPRDCAEDVEPEQGILYASGIKDSPKQFAILKSRTMTDASSSFVWYDWYVHRTHLVERHQWIKGDAEFMILLTTRNWSLEYG